MRLWLKRLLCIHNWWHYSASGTSVCCKCDLTVKNNGTKRAKSQKDPRNSPYRDVDLLEGAMYE